MVDQEIQLHYREMFMYIRSSFLWRLRMATLVGPTIWVAQTEKLSKSC